MKRDVYLILTCEHAGNRVPAEYRHLFRGRSRILASHRGYDPGALDLARFLSARLSAPLFACHVTRLLVEPNRSCGHPVLFSEMTAGLDREEKAKIMRRWYHPHRNAVEDSVREALALPESYAVNARGRIRGRRSPGSMPHSAAPNAPRLVVHVGVHTFTPVLNGEVRRADAGLLYDPGRGEERTFCLHWRDAWHGEAPFLAIRRNYPYRGAADSLPTHLRRVFPASMYLGLELEVNQRHIGSPAWKEIRESCERSLAAALQSPRQAERSLCAT